MPDMRLFVAIALSDDIVTHLEALQQTLARGPGGQAGRWVNPQSIHLTLKFLGNVDSRLLAELCEAVTRGCQGINPFPLEIAGLGCFPNTRRPSIVWTGIQASDSLDRLQSQIESELVKLGFAPEKRPFRPHLTLARVKRPAPAIDIQRLGRHIDAHPRVTHGQMLVAKIDVIKSDLRPGGAVYTTLYEAALGE